MSDVLSPRIAALSAQHPAKFAAAQASLHHIQSDSLIGMGTGSTVFFLVELLADALKTGVIKNVYLVPTSEQTRIQAESHGIPIITSFTTLDLTIDGADEIDSCLNAIKGGGGALLREKIVASSSREFIVIADHTKSVETLGTFPLPVECIPFAQAATQDKIGSVLSSLNLDDARITQRMGSDHHPFTTDNGNIIFDIACGQIRVPHDLADALSDVPGVVEHGLFLDMVTTLYLGTMDGLVIEHKKP